jgi:hypothetical protein
MPDITKLEFMMRNMQRDLSYAGMGSYLEVRCSSAMYRYLNMLKKNATPIYRLQINHDHSVNVDVYDMIEKFAPELEKYYSSVNDLPIWVQRKLSVLMLLDVNKINEEIDQVGKRINKNIFWVFKGENDG